jgi:hypothetical protein
MSRVFEFYIKEGFQLGGSYFLKMAISIHVLEIFFLILFIMENGV